MIDINQTQRITVKGHTKEYLVDVREYPIMEVGALCISFIEYDCNLEPTHVISIPATDIMMRKRVYTPEYEELMVSASAAAEERAIADYNAAQAAKATPPVEEPAAATPDTGELYG
jgi:5-keto 4-deoxyuronate isomerase